MSEESQEPIISENQVESIKLTKNTKGFTWVVKLIGNPMLDDKILDRLENYNKELQRRYGIKND